MKTTPPDAIGRLIAAPELRALARAVDRTRAVTASGLWGSSVAAVVAALQSELSRPVMLICGHIDEADDLADDIELFTRRRPDVLPALELSGNLGRVSEEQVSNRLKLISTYAGGKIPPESVLVTPVQALMQSVPSKDQLKWLTYTLNAGQELEPEKLIVWLSDHGYNRLDQVEVPGDFAVRGGIIDVYVPGDFANEDVVQDHSEGKPDTEQQVGLSVRIDFFGDQIESIKTFDIDTLGSGRPMETVKLLDLKGQLPETSSSTSVFTYLPEDTIVVLWAPLEIAEQAKSYLDRLPEQKGIYPLSAVLRNAAPFARVELSQFDQGTAAMPSFIGGEKVEHFNLPIRSLTRFETEAKKALAELAELALTHDVSVFCENAGEAKRFCELLDTDQPGVCEKIAVPTGYIHRGFIWDPEGSKDEGGRLKDEAAKSPSDSTLILHPSSSARPLAVLGHHELFHRYEQRRRVKRVIASRPVDSFLDLKVGDYVVHVTHGIAKFTGMQTINKDGQNEEYLTLRFAENAALHVPAARINLIQKYVGGFNGHPQLSRLGSGAWEKQKAKVTEAVMDMAAELIEVQAARNAEQGFAYPPDTAWQKEFEDEFPYTPTVDQVTSNEEIKADMTRLRPMDRLLCGDVGYGKTELAMRAAFKAAETGKQVAVLVPTTVLAEQHYRSFRERMANYPFRIESISRFRTNKEARDITNAAKAGEVDILIGTHRLISKDVGFKDLGLVVIDEEQRFGVTHKERLKQMRKTVDVLTMSATPIPRTLHMSMLGLRDISSLTTAPQDRRSVVTEVMAYDANRVKLAILRELQREGQIYFVHNKVHDIQTVADTLQAMVPDARIIIGHGQMADGEMEEAMVKFIRHEADILVCTTIIESGLDIPNANTMIIDSADRFGLSELHQLRGRVGRWKHRAYCYLLLPPDRPVTPVASKRLKAIEEYSHLGAGFKIAMRDLEIRGAGNILGPEQSGHIATVGYEMYCQLLEEAVRSLKKEPRPTTPDAHVDIGISAFIPKTYIPGDRQRMDVYRRMTRCTSIEMLTELTQDATDAFGEPPRQVLVLYALTELRLLAGIYGIESMIRKEPDVALAVRDGARAQKGLLGAPGTLRVIDEKTIYLRPPKTYLEPETLLMVLRNLMRGAYDKEKAGIEIQMPTTPVNAPKVAQPMKVKPMPRDATPTQREAVAKVVTASKAAAPPKGAAGGKSSATADYQKLVALRDGGVLTEEEFTAACRRMLAAK